MSEQKPVRAIEHTDLNPVGRMMLDSARIFATAGVTVPTEYLQRVLRNRRQEKLV